MNATPRSPRRRPGRGRARAGTARPRRASHPASSKALASEHLRVALLHSPAVVFTQDRDLRYTWVHNTGPAWREREVLGRRDADLFPADEAQRLTAIKRGVLEHGRGAREIVAISLAGERRWVDLTVEPLRGRGGRIVGVTCASWDVTDQTRAQDEVRRLAVLEERNRLAREMHDSLAQGLVAVVLRLEAGEETVRTDPSRGVETVRAVRDMVRGVLDEARRSLLALRPRLLDQADLCGALEHLGGDIGSRTSAAVRVAVRGRPRPLGGEVEENLLRLAQEALQNAVRHAQARSIRLELSFTAHEARLAVEDDGHGFDPVARAGTGLGLDMMRERAQRVGGALEVRSAPGAGARVEVRVPAVSRGTT